MSHHTCVLETEDEWESMGVGCWKERDTHCSRGRQMYASIHMHRQRLAQRGCCVDMMVQLRLDACDHIHTSLIRRRAHDV